MDTMDTQALFDATGGPGIPSPFWITEALKVLGFCLHVVPMNLWYAGILVAMLLYAFGGEHGKRFCNRLMLQMPVIIAFGINFGIVPLLFVQVAYFRVFYPATILMAWPWLLVILWVTVAYYGAYVYAFGLRDEGEAMKPWKRAMGWVSAALFVITGFTFVNALSLMTNVAGWTEIWRQQQPAGAAGAVAGTALNLGDPTLVPRWLLMLGLAVGTTAAWMVVDSAWFGRRESDGYRRWVSGFAPKLYLVGAAWFALAGTWYVFLAMPINVFGSVGLAVAGLLAAAAPVGALALVWLLRERAPGDRKLALAVGLSHFGAIACNAIARQAVQNVELKPYLDVAAQPTAVQWSPLIVFLLLFVGGLVAIGWMIAQVANLRTDTPA